MVNDVVRADGIEIGLLEGVWGIGGSMIINASCSMLSGFSEWGDGSGSGRISVPSDNCLNIRFTAIIPAAPVSADKSAPT